MGKVNGIHILRVLLSENSKMLDAITYTNEELIKELGVDYGFGSLSHVHTKLSTLIKEYDTANNHNAKNEPEERKFSLLEMINCFNAGIELTDIKGYFQDHFKIDITKQ